VSYPLADAGCKIFFGVRTERPDYSYGRNCADRKIQDGNLVVAEQSDISNDAGLLQELFEQTGTAAQQLRLSHRFCSLHLCHPNLLCLFASSLSGAHQTSLRSRSTMMSHANSLSGGG